jgi:hypothetical protein
MFCCSGVLISTIASILFFHIGHRLLSLFSFLVACCCLLSFILILVSSELMKKETPFPDWMGTVNFCATLTGIALLTVGGFMLM